MLFALVRSLGSEFAWSRVKYVLLASLAAILLAGVWTVQVVLPAVAISLSLLVLFAFGIPAAYARTKGKKLANLDAALASMCQGVAIFDADQRIVIANRRYREMYDLSPEQIKPGTPLREVLDARAAKGFYGDENTKKWVEWGLANFHKEASDVVHLSDGRVISVQRRPMPNGGLVSTHEDITRYERMNARIEHQHKLLKAQEEKLKAKNLLATALDNMGEGLCMFDAENRLLVCNDRYAKLYDLPPHLLAVGTPHEAIIAHGVSNSILKGEKGSVAVARKLFALGQLPTEASSSRIEELADGRLICVTNHPMTEGGWVATHEDISARLLAERRLQETKRFLDTIIENLPMPVVVKDPSSLRFILVNQAYEDFLGVSRDSLLGKTAQEIFEPESADLIAKCDRDALGVGENVIAKDLSLRTPSNRNRLVTATKLVVRNDADQPQHLITVLEDITDRREAERKILHMAQHDALTDLPNRILLRERLEQALACPRPGDRGLAIYFLDLDRFKEINDTLGHDIGDALLKAVAERLRSCVRDTATIARLGGDEFAIVEEVLDAVVEATTLAERIQEALNEPFDLGDHHVTVGTSIGIAIAPGDGNDTDHLLKNADLALYRAKNDGRGTHRFFEHEMDRLMHARRDLERDLRGALVNGELQLYYQPLLDLKSDRISGCEALLRWHHPKRGTVSPAEFISLAEETGLIVPIGDWVLRTACAEAANWPDRVRIAVNLSPAQFASPQLVPVIVSALATSGIAPQRLELEVTESVMMRDTEATFATLRQLHELGIRIALDDFGTGYSSLSFLRRFPFDNIKIDRAFISELADEKEDSRAIVRSVVQLAVNLGKTTTAEGVETKELLELVRTEGCTEVQGYYFSRPKPASEIARLLHARGEQLSSAA